MKLFKLPAGVRGNVYKVYDRNFMRQHVTTKETVFGREKILTDPISAKNGNVNTLGLYTEDTLINIGKGGNALVVSDDGKFIINVPYVALERVNA